MTEPLTEDKIFWLDDETDTVYYRKAENSDECEREVVDLQDVRRAVEGLRAQLHQRTKDPESLCGWEVEQAINHWFPVFAKKERCANEKEK